MSGHLATCPACARHVRVTETACPFCRETFQVSFGESAPRRAPMVRLRRAALYALGVGTLTMSTACSKTTSSVDAGGDTDAGQSSAGPAPQDAAMDSLQVVALYGMPPLPEDAAVDAAQPSPPAQDAGADASPLRSPHYGGPPTPRPSGSRLPL
jgi:hypothetical protein